MKRTLPQNRALHLYCERLAEALDESGYDMQHVVTLPIRPTKENVKENIFKVVMNAMYPEVESTADLTTDEMQKVYEVVNRAISDRFGIFVAWPSEESLSMEAQR